MRVLILGRTLWPKGSGGELATYLYANLLSKLDLEVTVLVSDSGVTSELYGFKVVYLPHAGLSKYSFPLRGRLFEKFVKQADIIYVTSAPWCLILLIKHLGKPVVVHLHSYDPVCPVGSLYNFVINSTCDPRSRICSKCIWLYERFHARSLTYSVGSLTLNSSLGDSLIKLLSYADALLFVSNAHKNLFLKHLRYILGFLIPRAYVIYNPISEVHYIKPSEFNVGYFGGLSPLKGYNILLKAWMRIWKKHPGTKLFATKMAKLVNSGVIKKVNIVAYNKLDPAEFNRLLSRVSIVVFPSIWQEPLPYVVIESLLHGRLLVASRVGGVPEIVDNVPGVKLIPPGDVNALVDALDWALSMDKRDIIELGLKNREYALRKFDNERAVRGLIRIFEKVLSR